MLLVFKLVFISLLTFEAADKDMADRLKEQLGLRFCLRFGNRCESVVVPKSTVSLKDFQDRSCLELIK